MVTTPSNKSFDWAKFNNLIWKDTIYAILPLLIFSLIQAIVHTTLGEWLNATLEAPEASFAAIILYSLSAKHSTKSENTSKGFFNRLNCSEAYMCLLILSVVTLTMALIIEKVPDVSKAVEFNKSYLRISQLALLIMAFLLAVRTMCWKQND